MVKPKSVDDKLLTQSPPAACSKPVAGQLKRYALDHHDLKKVTMAVGRGYESFTQRIEIAFRGHHVKNLKPIPDAHALTVGADLLSQSFLLSIAIGLVVFEYWRNERIKRVDTAVKKREKAERQAAKEARLRAIEDRIAELEASMTKEESGLLSSTMAALPSLPFLTAKPKPGGAAGAASSAVAAAPPPAQQEKGSKAAAAASAQEAKQASVDLHVPQDTFQSLFAPAAAAEAAKAARRAAALRSAELAERDEPPPAGDHGTSGLK
jgi:hypothetical protein